MTADGGRRLAAALGFWRELRLTGLRARLSTARRAYHAALKDLAERGVAGVNDAPEALRDDRAALLSFAMGQPRYGFVRRDDDGCVVEVRRRAVACKPAFPSISHRLKSGATIEIDPFEWSRAPIIVDLAPPAAARVVAEWFAHYFDEDDPSVSPHLATEPSEVARISIFLVDFGGADEEAALDLLLLLAQAGARSVIASANLSPELREAASLNFDQTDARYRDLWDAGWNAPYPRDVVERAVARVAAGRDLAYRHKYYCGIGVTFVDGVFHIGHVEDGCVGLDGPRFETVDALTDWLTGRTNASMNGHDPSAPLFEESASRRGNQRITLARLIEHGAIDVSGREAPSSP